MPQAMTTRIDSMSADTMSGIVLTVTHAGRDYPDWVADALALPMAQVQLLEDRFADLLVADAAAAGFQTLIARTPRLVIDLNRDETDFMAAAIDGSHHRAARPSHRARGGLGLIPERLGHHKIWKSPPGSADLAARIATIHRRWHGDVAEALARARAQHGRVVLIDVHSMPPLPGANAAQIVIGTRHGLSASTAVAMSAADVFRCAGLRTEIDAPYAGAHMIERHGKPANGFSAIQVEIDRRLYLDGALDAPGPGLPGMRRLIATLARTLAIPREAKWLDAAE